MTAKFVGYFRLVEACERPGCPVCACLEDDSRRALGALLTGHVTDVATRRRLRESWGFCNWHTWALVDTGNAATGAAILYEDLVRVCQSRLEGLRVRRSRALVSPLRWLRGLLTRARRTVPRIVERHQRRPRCLVCSQLAVAETGYVDAIVASSADPELGRAYQRSTGLCVPHLLFALERSGDADGVERILESTLAKWDTLRADLDRFVAKHEYRNVTPFDDTDASSYVRASEVLAGRRQVFGNDMPRSSA